MRNLDTKENYKHKKYLILHCDMTRFTLECKAETYTQHIPFKELATLHHRHNINNR